MANEILRRSHVRIDGGGSRTIVFGHGLGADQRIWRLVAPRFAVDHRVVLFDLIGGGESDRSQVDQARYASLDGHARDLVEICEALAAPPVIFVGHSVSAMIGVLAALRAPQRFSSLILLAASPRYLDDPPAYTGGLDAGSLDRLLDLMEDNFVGWSDAFVRRASQNADLQREMNEAFHNHDRPMLRQLAEVTLRSDIRRLLPEVTTPCLLLPCEQDDFVPRSAAQYLGDHLPRAELEWLPVSGHCPQMSHPLLVEKAIRDYLARAETRAAGPLRAP